MAPKFEICSYLLETPAPANVLTEAEPGRSTFLDLPLQHKIARVEVHRGRLILFCLIQSDDSEPMEIHQERFVVMGRDANILNVVEKDAGEFMFTGLVVTDDNVWQVWRRISVLEQRIRAAQMAEAAQAYMQQQEQEQQRAGPQRSLIKPVGIIRPH